MQLQLANFIRGRLAANITAASTSIPLTAAAFPALAGGAVCYAVLQSATDRSVVEIVKVTTGGATLTVERGQEGTVARAFAANDIIEQRLTAGQFQSVVDHSNAASAHVPAGVAGKFLKGVAGGTPIWDMPTAAEVGALPIVGGVLTGTHPITLNTSLGTVTAASFAGSLSGNAASATKWATARTLSFTGHAAGSMSVDGSGNASAALTLAASGITAGTYKSVTFDIYGRATAGTNPTTLAGYGITDAAKTHPPLNFGGSMTPISTADFITQLTNLGAFNSVYWCTKAAWSYFDNNYITDTGVGVIQLAGCTVEVIGGNAASYTIRIHTSPTVSIEGAVPNADFVYVNHGEVYAPKWHKIYNTDNKPTAADIGAASSFDLSTAIAGRVPIASRIDWSSKGVIGCTVGMLGWKNYGNGHVIFDASNGTSPDGQAIDSTNPQVQWGATYPTLMGWSGTNTYGVRVDSARVADSATTADRITGTVSTEWQDLKIHGKRAMVGVNDTNQLIINYANDWGSTLIQGQLYTHALESNRHLVVHNGSTVYGNSGLEVRTTDGSDARIGFHRAGYTAGAINHNAWGFQFERESGGGSRANVAAANFFADAAQDTAGNALTRKDYVDSNLDAKAGIEHVHNVATQAAAGFMSSADKLKLDNLGSGGVADSANKLTTSRLINGTLFDGTSDISTANWGASRTITIGARSKVVDGSSNVSWSIAELGCLPITGGTLSGSIKVPYGVYVHKDGYPLNYCSLQVYDNVATIMSNSNLTSGFRVTTNDTTCFLVDPAGELYASGIYRVYHTNNKPTASDVGLGLVNNTSDVNKPISTATQTALNSKEATIALGTTAQYWRGDKSWQSLNKAAVGLGNVNDTSDLNKPISTATQTALDAKYSPSNRPTPADIGALPAAGTAVAATKLATARTIAGKSFDGTANISIAAADVGALPASGGTLSGGLITSSTIKLTDTSATDTTGLLNPFGRTIARGSTVAANVFGNYTDAMFFHGNSLTAWQVRYNNISYPIYHTGNKPTPAEIGAQPATSDIRVKSNIASLSPVLDKIMLIDPKTFTMEGREGTCVGTIAQDWEVDFPEVLLNVPSTAQGEPEMLKGIDALGTIGILLKAIQELKGEIEELKNR